MEQFCGSRAVLSGPAGGVVGYAVTCYGFMEKKPVIGFDMGGERWVNISPKGFIEWLIGKLNSHHHLLTLTFTEN